MFMQSASMVIIPAAISIPIAQEEVFYLDNDYTDVANVFMNQHNSALKSFDEIEQIRLQKIIESMMNYKIIYEEFYNK